MSDKHTLIRQLVTAHHTHNAAQAESAARELQHNYTNLPANIEQLVIDQLGPVLGWRHPANYHH